MDGIKQLLEQLGVEESLLNEDFVKSLGLLVEAKINEHKDDVEERLEEENRQSITEFKEKLTDQIDEYLAYFAEEYIRENKENIIGTVEVNTANKILEAMSGFVNDFNIELSEETISDSDEIDDLRGSLNTAVNKNIALERENRELNQQTLINEFANENIGTASERSSFKRLAENFEFEDEETFTEKLVYLKENIILATGSGDSDDNLENQEEIDAQKQTLKESDNGSDMKNYLKVLAKNSA